jgi:hypothetical protein
MKLRIKIKIKINWKAVFNIWLIIRMLLENIIL